MSVLHVYESVIDEQTQVYLLRMKRKTMTPATTRINRITSGSPTARPNDDPEPNKNNNI